MFYCHRVVYCLVIHTSFWSYHSHCCVFLCESEKGLNKHSAQNTTTFPTSRMTIIPKPAGKFWEMFRRSLEVSWPWLLVKRRTILVINQWCCLIQWESILVYARIKLGSGGWQYNSDEWNIWMRQVRDCLTMFAVQL